MPRVLGAMSALITHLPPHCTWPSKGGLCVRKLSPAGIFTSPLKARWGSGTCKGGSFPIDIAFSAPSIYQNPKTLTLFLTETQERPTYPGPVKSFFIDLKSFFTYGL